jgi:hypothetical protein
MTVKVRMTTLRNRPSEPPRSITHGRLKGGRTTSNVAAGPVHPDWIRATGISVQVDIISSVPAIAAKTTLVKLFPTLAGISWRTAAVTMLQGNKAGTTTVSLVRARNHAVTIEPRQWNVGHEEMS